jgi:hypothetical protein
LVPYRTSLPHLGHLYHCSISTSCSPRPRVCCFPKYTPTRAEIEYLPRNLVKCFSAFCPSAAVAESGDSGPEAAVGVGSGLRSAPSWDFFNRLQQDPRENVKLFCAEKIKIAQSGERAEMAKKRGMIKARTASRDTAQEAVKHPFAERGACSRGGELTSKTGAKEAAKVGT